MGTGNWNDLLGGKNTTTSIYHYVHMHDREYLCLKIWDVWQERAQIFQGKIKGYLLIRIRSTGPFRGPYSISNSKEG